MRTLLSTWAAALMFYTCLPVPPKWPLDFRRIARWVPAVGGVIGGLLAGWDVVLGLCNVPVIVRSGLVVALGIWLTGGLHLDGVMDVADGLAVPDRDRRLAVMADSRMGAFGGMAAVVVLGLKVLALASISAHRGWILVGVAVWGRWAQQWAIARYPYLRPAGKGTMHQAALPYAIWVLPGLGAIALTTALITSLGWIPVFLAWQLSCGGLAFSILTGAYFNHQLGGHTGDTYGAVVEWTEAFLLCAMTVGLSA